MRTTIYILRDSEGEDIVRARFCLSCFREQGGFKPMNATVVRYSTEYEIEEFEMFATRLQISSYCNVCHKVPLIRLMEEIIDL